MEAPTNYLLCFHLEFSCTANVKNKRDFTLSYRKRFTTFYIKNRKHFALRSIQNIVLWIFCIKYHGYGISYGTAEQTELYFTAEY